MSDAFPFVVDTAENSKDAYLVRIRPEGFWSDVITVRGQAGRINGEHQMGPVKITWSSGGFEKGYCNKIATKNFIAALQYATDLANAKNKGTPFENHVG